MATTIAELDIKLNADTGGAKNTLKDVDKSFRDLGASADEADSKSRGFLGGLGGALGGAALMGGAAVIGGIGAAFVKGMGEASEWQDAITQTEAVIKSTGGAAGFTAEEIGKLSESLSASNGLSKFSDDAILSANNLLLTFTGIGKDVFPDVSQAAVDMAQALGTDVTSAAMQLGKALNDPADGMGKLARSGVSFTDAQKFMVGSMQSATDAAGAFGGVMGEIPAEINTLLKGVTNADEAMQLMAQNGVAPLTEEQERMFRSIVDGNGKMEAQKLMLAELSKEFGGSAAAAAGTFSGKMTQLSEKFNDFVQGLAERVMPMLSGFLDWLMKPETLAAIEGLANGLIDGVGKAVSFIGDVINTVMPILQPFIDAWGNFFGSIGEGTPVLEAVGELLGNLTEALWDGLGSIGEMIGEWVTGGGLEAFTDNIGEWAEALWEWVQEDAIPGLMTALGKLGEAVWGWITGGGLQGLVSNLVTWGGAILGFIAKDVLPFLGQKLLDLGKFIWDWITGGGLTSLISNLVTWGGAFLGWIAKDVLPFIGQKLGELGKAIWDWISQTATDLVKELAKFAVSFWTWITGENGVVAGIPGKLAEIWNGITKWIGETVTNIVTEGAKLVTAFWDWITGPTGIVANIGTKLGEVWTAITTWVGDTVKNIPAEAGKIGGAMLDGIMSGIGNLGKQLWDFISKIANDIWQGLVSFFTGQPAPTPTAPPPPGAPPGGGTPPSPPRPPDPRYGPRAEGGGVWAGGTYLVGERGPEMFVPKMSGSIIPNHALGGDTFQVTIHAGIGSDPHVIGQVVTQAISRSLSLRQRSKGYR